MVKKRIGRKTVYTRKPKGGKRKTRVVVRKSTSRRKKA